MKIVSLKDAKAARSSDPADWEVIQGLKHIVERMERGEFKCKRALLTLLLEEPEKEMMGTATVAMGVSNYIESLGILHSASLDVSMMGVCAPNEPSLAFPLEAEL